MENVKYWYLSRNPKTNEIVVNMNLPKPEKDIVFKRTGPCTWALQTAENNCYTVDWEYNYRTIHAKGCFCEGECIFIREAALIDNIFLSRVETEQILDGLCK